MHQELLQTATTVALARRRGADKVIHGATVPVLLQHPQGGESRRTTLLTCGHISISDCNRLMGSQRAGKRIGGDRCPNSIEAVDVLQRDSQGSTRTATRKRPTRRDSLLAARRR